MRRLATAATAALISLAAALPAAAEVSINEISNYFASFRTGQSKFTQVNADGSISTGTLYIKRPGRMRFEYDPPVEQLVLAGGGQVAIFDGRSNVANEQYPLSETPLSIILAENVDLARSGMVTAHGSDGTTTSLTAQDPDRPEIGSIRLVFTEGPTELRQWVTTNSVGEQTTVILGELVRGVDLPPSTFSLDLAKQRF